MTSTKEKLKSPEKSINLIGQSAYQQATVSDWDGFKNSYNYTHHSPDILYEIVFGHHATTMNDLLLQYLMTSLSYHSLTKDFDWNVKSVDIVFEGYKGRGGGPYALMRCIRTWLQQPSSCTEHLGRPTWLGLNVSLSNSTTIHLFLVSNGRDVLYVKTWYQLVAALWTWSHCMTILLQYIVSTPGEEEVFIVGIDKYLFDWLWHL